MKMSEKGKRKKEKHVLEESDMDEKQIGEKKSVNQIWAIENQVLKTSMAHHKIQINFTKTQLNMEFKYI